MVVQNERNGLDAALTEIENEAYRQNHLEPFDVNVKHGVSLAKTTVYMTGANLLIQVFEGAAKDLGFKEYSPKAVFVNEKTGKSTSDSEMSLDEFEIGPEEVLTIFPDGHVAANQ